MKNFNDTANHIAEDAVRYAMQNGIALDYTRVLRQTFTEKRAVMNSQKDSTKYDVNIQEAFHNWNRKILPHLPDHMDEMAYQSGILQRKRGIHSAVDLLKMLFLYASSKFSFRILAAAACALEISGISDTAWRKHFVRAVPFLHELLHAMLSSFLTSTDIPTP